MFGEKLFPQKSMSFVWNRAFAPPLIDHYHRAGGGDEVGVNVGELSKAKCAIVPSTIGVRVLCLGND